MKLIYKADNITEAHIIKGLLESHDIPAHVGGFYLQGGVGDLAARDYANVQVADEDQQLAIEIITEYEGTTRSSSRKSTTKENTVFYKVALTLFVSIVIIAIFSLVAQ